MSNLGQKVLLLWFLNIAHLLRESDSVPSPHMKEHEVDIELLSEESNPDPRMRREADSNLPDQLSFQVPMTTGEVTLRMKRARLLPTTTSHSDVTTPFSQNAGVYTDLESGATMIVRREDDQYNLRGFFLHDQAEWHLEPLDKTKRQAGRKSHKLLPGVPDVATVSLDNDAVEDPEPPVEILSLAERNRYRLQRLARQRGDKREVPIGYHKNETRTKSKRATTEHIVEMAFVVDRGDYDKWVTYKGASTAMAEMTLWYTYMAEAINVCYRTIVDSDIEMGSKVKSLKIITAAGDGRWVEDLLSSNSFDGEAGLSSFRQYIEDPSNGIPNADHYMHFTGYDINGGAIGIAYLSRVCTTGGVSITENDFTTGTGVVAAHELGHSLSANHDSRTRSCSDSTENIMSAIYSMPVSNANRGNPWRFSPCSIAAFKSYLNGVSCTEPANTGSTDLLPAPTGDDRAGLVLNRDDQCRQFYQDSRSSYCSTVQNQNGGEERLCQGMFCDPPSGGGSCQAIMPLDYTTCGMEKWCRTGLCLDHGVEPTNPPVQPGPSAPETIFDCFPFLLRLDFLGLLNCFGQVLFG